MKKVDKSLIISIGIFIIIDIIFRIITGTFIPCIIKRVTGFYCPGCGITRMFVSILKLDFYQAFRYNVFLFILLIITVIYEIIKLISIHLFNKQLRLNNYIYLVLLVLTIGFGIIRNIPAFSYLIPTVVK